LFTFFDLYFVYFLQYSDTVGWVFWPVKTVGRITYIVLAQTLNHAQPNEGLGRDSPPPPAHQIFTSQGKGLCGSFSCSYIRVLWNYDFIKMLPTDNAAGLDEVCRRISPPCFLAECHKRWVVFSLSILCIFNCLFSSVNQRECHCIAQLCWCDVKNLLTYLTPCGLQQSRPYPVAVAIFNNLQSVCDGVSVWLYSLC